MLDSIAPVFLWALQAESPPHIFLCRSEKEVHHGQCVAVGGQLVRGAHV